MIHELLVDTDSHLIRLQHSHACGRLIILLKTFWLDYYDRFTWVALSIETLRITKFNRKCATTTGLIPGQTYMLLVVTHFRVVMFDDIAQLFFVTNEIKDEFSLVLFSL